MVKLKHISLLLSLVLVFSVFVMGCEESEEPAEDSEEEVYQVQLIGGRPDDPWNVLSHALGQFINTQSDNLEAEVIPSAGIGDNTRTAKETAEDRESSIVVTMIPGHEVWGEAEDYYPRKVASLSFLNDVWVTYDEDIETIEDFEGKNIALPRDVELSYTWIFDNWLQAAGVEDYELMHGGIGARSSALMDGAVDIATIPMDFYFPDKYEMSSNMMELEGRDDIHLPNQGNVEQNLEWIEEAGQMEPFEDEYELPNLGMTMPPDAFDEGLPEEELVYIATPVYWAAGEEVPDDVIYEVTRIIHENIQDGQFEPHHAHAEGLTEEHMTTSFWTDEEEREEQYHPGALEYYEDQGMELQSHFD